MKFSIPNKSAIKKLDQLVITLSGNVAVMQPVFKLTNSENDVITPIVYSEYYETTNETCIFFMPKKLRNDTYTLSYVYGAILKNESGNISMPEFSFTIKSKITPQPIQHVPEEKEEVIIEPPAMVTMSVIEDEPEPKVTSLDEVFSSGEIIANTTLEDIKEELNTLAVTVAKEEEASVITDSNVLTVDGLTISQTNSAYILFSQELLSVDISKVLVANRNGILPADIYSVEIDSTDKYTLILKVDTSIVDTLLQVTFNRNCFGSNSKISAYCLVNARNNYVNSYELMIKTLYPDADENTIISASGYILNRINNIRPLSELTVSQISKVFECVIQADNSPYNSTSDSSSGSSSDSGLYLSSATLGDLSASWSVNSTVAAAESATTSNSDFTILDYRMCFSFCDGLSNLNGTYFSVDNVFGAEE